MSPEEAALKIAEEHLQNTDPEAVKALTSLITSMRQMTVGVTAEEWEQAYQDWEKRFGPKNS
jgi:hypothetical protein